MTYFLTTIEHGSTNKLRPLPYQTDENGNEINVLLNTQADSVMRETYPIGTVFATERLILQEKRNTPYYCATGIFPVGLNIDEYEDPKHIPNKKMQDDYVTYMMEAAKHEAEQNCSAEKVNQSAAPIGSLRERLMKRHPKPTIKKDGFYITDMHWQMILRNIERKKNTMMVGPTGTGKTELVMLAAKSLGVPCTTFDMGSMHDPIAGMLGTHRLKKGGESVFDYAEFTKAVSRPGVVLLDELSRAPVTTLNILFPCLDSRRVLPVEIAGGEDMRSIKVHPECVFFATANVGAEYTGTATMDRALTARFFPLELDYMPIDEETNVLMTRCGITQKAARNIAKAAATIRSMFAKDQISTSVSTRETLQAAELVADGWKELEALEMTFLPLFEGNTSDGERSIISKVILAL